MQSFSLIFSGFHFKIYLLHMVERLDFFVSTQTLPANYLKLQMISTYIKHVSKDSQRIYNMCIAGGGGQVLC